MGTGWQEHLLDVDCVQGTSWQHIVCTVAAGWQNIMVVGVSHYQSPGKAVPDAYKWVTCWQRSDLTGG